MPFINAKLLEGVFSDGEKELLRKTITDAIVHIKGESIRSSTWVVFDEVKSGNWWIGDQQLITTEILAAKEDNKGD